MSREEKRAKLKRDRAYIAAENKKWPAMLKGVPREDWPPQRLDAECPIIALLRSSGFLCQVYAEPKHPEVLVRLSIHRTALNDAGGWVDGITVELGGYSCDMQVGVNAHYTEHPILPPLPTEEGATTIVASSDERRPRILLTLEAGRWVNCYGVEWPAERIASWAPVTIGETVIVR